MVFGGLIQSCSIGIQKYRHLIDERSRSSGTSAIHALFYGLTVKSDLRVLSPKLDGNICLRDQRFHRCAGGYDFLFKRNSQYFRQRKTTAPGDRNVHFFIAPFIIQPLQQLGDLAENIGHMPFINGIYHFPISVEQYQLDRC